MKLFTKTLLTLMALGATGFAEIGTTTAGGILVPESSIACNGSGKNLYVIDISIVKDPTSSSNYTATILQSSMNGLFSPLSYTAVTRYDETFGILNYDTEGFSLVIDLRSGQTSMPPTYKADFYFGGRSSSSVSQVVYCTLNY